MNYYKLFLESLQELMTNENITPAILARELGCAKSTVARWLHNSSLPKVKYLYLLSAYFDCSFDYILGLTDDKKFTRNLVSVDFPTRLKNMLKSKDKTEYRFAKDCNFHNGRYNHWFVKLNIPRTENLVTMAKSLDCSVEYLLGISDTL